jgi:hypothetical protein
VPGTPASISSSRLAASQTIGAPVRSAIAAASPKWSNAAWETRMTSGVSTSSGPSGAAGFALRNGSTTIRAFGPTIS